MNQTTIGSALVEKRRELGLEKGQAADKIGMSRTTYSSYEQDAQRPSVDVFPALAVFLDVSMEELLTLYGATCVAAVRPTLERVLSGRDGDPKETTSVEESRPVIGEFAPSSPEELTGVRSAETLDVPDNVVTEVKSNVNGRDTHDYESTELSEPGSAVEPTESDISSILYSQRSPELEWPRQLEESPASGKAVRTASFESSTSIFKRELSDGSEHYPDIKKKKKKKKKKKN